MATQNTGTRVDPSSAASESYTNTPGFWQCRDL
jgi:hypothetical protein